VFTGVFCVSLLASAMHTEEVPVQSGSDEPPPPSPPAPAPVPSTTAASAVESGGSDTKLAEMAGTVNEFIAAELSVDVSIDSLKREFAELATQLASVQSELERNGAMLQPGHQLPPDFANALIKRKRDLLSAINAQARKAAALRQTAYISSNEHLSDFYFSMQPYVESAFISARALRGGYVEKNDAIAVAPGMSTRSKIASVLSRGVKKAGKYIPLIGPLVEAVGAVAVAVSEQVALMGVRRIVASAASVTVMSDCIERVARLVCLRLHDPLMALTSSLSAQGIRAALQSARGDVHIGGCAELAKKAVSRLLRDFMLDASDSKKVLDVPLDASDACVLSVCSFVLEHEVNDLSIDAKVQAHIDAHTAASMPAQSHTSTPATSAVAASSTSIAAIGIPVSVASSDGKAMNFADAAEVEAMKARHDAMEAQHQLMEQKIASLLARRQPLQDDDDDDKDEDSSVAVGGGSQQQAMLSAKSKSSKRANANSAATEDEVEALRARIQQLEAEQQRTRQHVHGNTELITRVAVAAEVEDAFEDTSTVTAAHPSDSNTQSARDRDELFQA
jgi:Skp family chaperone for outer membrane proteins